jgi:hypothetical protein
VELGDCHRCRRTVDGDSAAVGLADDGSTTWVPFVEDLRTSGYRLVHPACFADARGLEALVDAVHEHDRKVRHETWELINEVERLKSGPVRRG